LIELRAAARQQKNFAAADKIRNELAAAGIVLEDRAGETDWSQGATAAASLADLMQLVIALRTDARTSKDFATADKIRDALNGLGIVLEDRADATDWTAGG
jgi:cysteinyl-tRNA synthetase